MNELGYCVGLLAYRNSGEMRRDTSIIITALYKSSRDLVKVADSLIAITYSTIISICTKHWHNTLTASKKRQLQWEKQ